MREIIVSVRRHAGTISGCQFADFYLLRAINVNQNSLIVTFVTSFVVPYRSHENSVAASLEDRFLQDQAEVELIVPTFRCFDQFAISRHKPYFKLTRHELLPLTMLQSVAFVRVTLLDATDRESLLTRVDRVF